MAVSNFGGKEAITHYRVIQRFDAYTHIRLKLETGRTHQIRVHMAHIGYPLVGDSAYAGRFKIPKGLDKSLIEKLRGFPRQLCMLPSLVWFIRSVVNTWSGKPNCRVIWLICWPI